MKLGSHHSTESKARMRKTRSRPVAPRPEASALHTGDMVVCPDGRVGLLAIVRVWGTSTVQFGTDGPFKQYPWKTLRRATLDEIADAGLEGVGCNQGMEFAKRRE